MPSLGLTVASDHFSNLETIVQQLHKTISIYSNDVTVGQLGEEMEITFVTM